MAKNNKYSSINFNHVYEKNSTAANSNTNPAKNHPSHPSSASSYSAASYSAVSSPNKPHGRMLVLTRPTPKPVSIPPPSSPHLQQQQPLNSVLQQEQHHHHQNQQLPLSDQPGLETGSENISLRPLGRTGAGSLLPSPVPNHDKDVNLLTPPVTSPKPDKFVPPHLRPGFVGREVKPGPEHTRSRDSGHRNPRNYGENGRPMSGGDRMRKGGYSDMGIMGRPNSSGSRPGSSGWFEMVGAQFLVRVKDKEEKSNGVVLIRKNSCTGANN